MSSAIARIGFFGAGLLVLGGVAYFAYIQWTATRDLSQEQVEVEADSERKALETYLQSDRVRQLLAPFCAPGRMYASNHGGLGGTIEELGKHPMSLSQLSRCECLAPTTGAMRLLTNVANKDNDRPAWPVDATSWEDAGETFLNMTGDKVNPYTEAQRILREHGALLVELKMLRE